MTTTKRERERLVRSATLVWAGARAALGVVALTEPARVSRPWIGDDADVTGNRVFARALGGRDLALGAGALYAAARGEGVRPWLLGSAAADLGDTVVTLSYWSRLPPGRRAFIATLTAGSTLTGLALTLATPRHPSRGPQTPATRSR
ncbi:hypothetical protein [Streptomyces sp. SID3343]|uniref:hypothetical protein n=1 Tax=Streptomyces sp. SID3343 TaxID=2690260 RepID=UPI00136A0374|nr:hypothetical protein [Streptomyces sp. SID3343]MYW05275.1 hypothetical protein [Streptomyces sp. SID3343]